VHRRTNDNTNYRVILSSVLEAIALVGCSVVQVRSPGYPHFPGLGGEQPLGCGVNRPRVASHGCELSLGSRWQVLYVRKQFAGKDNPNRAMV